MLWCDAIYRSEYKANEKQWIFFSFEVSVFENFNDYLHLYLNTFTNKCIYNCSKEKDLNLNTSKCIWPHVC